MTSDGEGKESVPLHIYLHIYIHIYIYIYICIYIYIYIYLYMYASSPWPMRRGRHPPRDIPPPARRRRRPPRCDGSSRSCTAATAVAPPTWLGLRVLVRAQYGRGHGRGRGFGLG